MKKIAAALLLTILAGCSSFHLGSMVYCPHEKTCAFQQND